ncbi:MAG: hypothetical protein HUU16_01855 [Candidatus Omnitrophica bacterium]|nr:hypothetical protein [Candidatus Omnitrophota bacterium]
MPPQPNYDVPWTFLDYAFFALVPVGIAAVLLMSPAQRKLLGYWVPRVLLGISVALLVYFVQRTFRFSGRYDETFLDPNNLGLVRGPLAKEEYYRRGEPDYVGKPLFDATAELETEPELGEPSLSEASPALRVKPASDEAPPPAPESAPATAESVSSASR